MSQPAASTIAPIFLRLSLGVTFIWAGLGKFMATMPVQGEQAAILANYGVGVGPVSSSTPVVVPPVPATTGSPVPKEDPKPNGSKGEVTPETDRKTPSDETVFAMPPAMRLMPQATPATARVHTAADFPEPVQVARLYGVTLLIDGAAHPKPATDGKVPRAIWPDFASQGKWPYYLAYAAAITEVVGGGLALIGFLTRLSALALAGTMVVALWLTQIGPPIQAGNAYLGFLPPHDCYDIAAWMPFFWPLALLASSLALLFSGSGSLAVDRVMFHRSKPVTSITKAA